MNNFWNLTFSKFGNSNLNICENLKIQIEFKVQTCWKLNIIWNLKNSNVNNFYIKRNKKCRRRQRNPKMVNPHPRGWRRPSRCIGNTDSTSRPHPLLQGADGSWVRSDPSETCSCQTWGISSWRRIILKTNTGHNLEIMVNDVYSEFVLDRGWLAFSIYHNM
jgi:hypothetical protein